MSETMVSVSPTRSNGTDTAKREDDPLEDGSGKGSSSDTEAHHNPFISTLLSSLLKPSLKHTAVLPYDDEYDALCNDHFNLDVICRPFLFLRPTSTEDISACLKAYNAALDEFEKWRLSSAREEGVCGDRENVGMDHSGSIMESAGSFPPLCICGGRHSTRSLRDGAVVLDLGKMTDVEVDADGLTVTVQGGVRVGDICGKLAMHGLAAVTGTHKNVGVIGLTLGGGHGLLSKQFGPAIDQIVSATVVLADGTIRRVQRDREEDKDIMFALRGGGGNVAVVSDLTMKVYRVKNVAMVENGHLCLTEKGMRDVLIRYGEWSADCPMECMSFCVMPVGSPIIKVVGVSSDTSTIPQDVTSSETNLNWADVPGLSALEHDNLGCLFRVQKKFEVMDLNNEAQYYLSKDEPAATYFTSKFIPSITPEIATILVEAHRRASKGISKKSDIVIFNAAGAKALVTNWSETAFEARDASYWILGQWKWDLTGNAKKDAAHRQKVKEFSEWLRDSLSAAGAKSSVHPVGGMENDFGHFSFSRNRLKMTRIQDELDPRHIFKVNRSI